MSRRLVAVAFGVAAVALGAASCSLVSGLDDLKFDESGAPCSADGQCDDGNACTIDSCGPEGLCVHGSLSGVPSPTQKDGDCKKQVCQDGEPIDQNDEGDVEDDSNDCTVDSCNSGQSIHTKKQPGEACKTGGANGRCDALGACVVECSASVACDDQEPCTTDTCDLSTGVCTFTPLDGVPTPGVTPVPGDCRANVCVAGKDTDVPDDTDLPNDTHECTDDICNGGVPSNPLRAVGSFCNGGASVCDAMGKCVACNVDTDCGGVIDDCQEPVCDNHVCKTSYTAANTPVSMQTTGDCKEVVCDGMGGTKVNAKNTDLPVDGNDCTADLCNNGVPSHMNLASNAPCGVGGTLVCNGNGQCVGCVNDTTCTSPATCGGGGMPTACGCTPKTCAQLGATCGAVPDGCGGTLNCNSGTKNGNETDVDCGGGMGCGLLCAQGKKCTKGADCQSGACVDGVCCNTPCSGVCLACSAAKKGAGADGTCGLVKAGTDPDNECPSLPASSCGTTGVCSDIGTCQKYPAGTVCSVAVCVNSTTLDKADTCDGNGTCVDGGTRNCAPNVCSGNVCVP